MSRFLVPIALFAALIPIFIFGLHNDPTALPSPFIGKPAPEFSLPSLKDPQKTVSSNDYDGRYALVNVWATWCVGCRHEHEFLLQLAERDELPIYGLNWRDRREDALEWLGTLGNPYVENAYDADGRVGIDWGVYGAPETFLVDDAGYVRHKYIGPLTAEAWQREFEPLLDAAKPGQP